MIDKIWNIKSKKTKEETIDEISKEHHIPRVISTILLNRGIESKDIAPYLRKSMADIINPMLMLDMDKAVERITNAIQSNEKIAVYGDYDVDGITSTALLYKFLLSLGADVEYYIPDRKGEGYGINIMAVNKLFKQGIKLMITVDCGITAIGEVEFAKLQGMDVIITDHHTCKDRLPTAAAAILNPKRPDCDYPFDALAGVGVAFKLILALAIKNGLKTTDVFNQYVDIATLGTIADVVPLLGENRVIVDKGLKILHNPKRIGIRAVMEVAGVLDKPLSASTIAFSIAPRLNAAGRLGSAATAVELLLTNDESRARELALLLDTENKERQQTERQIFDEALELIGFNDDDGNRKPTDKVFIGFNDSLTQTPLKNWLKAAGITKHITYHCSRHTLGSLQVEAGTSVYTVQHILGHKNVSTTQIYAAMADESKRESINRITLKPKITPQLKVVGQG